MVLFRDMASAQALQGALNALFGGGFGAVEMGGNFGKAEVGGVTKGEGFAVARRERRDQGIEFIGACCGGGFWNLHLKGIVLLFAGIAR